MTQQQQPKPVVLPACPRCRNPLIVTQTGIYCPKCGYRRVKKDG